MSDAVRKTQTSTETQPSAPPGRRNWMLDHRWGLGIALSAAVFCVGGVLGILFIPDAILHNWFPSLDDKERAQFLWPAAQAVLFTLGGAIAVFGVALSMARHREELLARSRAEATLRLEKKKERTRQRETEQQRRIAQEISLRERFVTATDLLSDTDAPIKRTAGMYALAAVADAWLDLGERNECQTCIDVLCAYLRAPLPHDQTSTQPEENAVKRAGYDLLRARLLLPANGTSPAWAGFSFNLTSALIDFSVNLTRLHCVGVTRINLEQATVVGAGVLLLDATTLADAAYFSMSGLDVRDGGRVIASNLELHAESRVLLSGATVSSNSSIAITDTALHDKASISISDARAEAGGRITIQEVHLHGSATVLAVRIRAYGDKSRVQFQNIVLDDQSVFVAKGARAEEHGVVTARAIGVMRESSFDLSRARVRRGGKAELIGFSTSGRSTLTIHDLKLEGGTVIVAQGTTDNASRVHAGFEVVGAKAKPVLARIRLRGESEFHIARAHSDARGRVWINSARIADADARVLGSVTLQGGALITDAGA